MATKVCEAMGCDNPDPQHQVGPEFYPFDLCDRCYAIYSERLERGMTPEPTPSQPTWQSQMLALWDSRTDAQEVWFWAWVDDQKAKGK